MKSVFAVLGADKGIVHVADGAEGFHNVSMGVGYVEVDYACALSCYRESHLDVIVHGEAESFGLFLASWYGEAHGNCTDRWNEKQDYCCCHKRICQTLPNQNHHYSSVMEANNDYEPRIMIHGALIDRFGCIRNPYSRFTSDLTRPLQSPRRRKTRGLGNV